MPHSEQTIDMPSPYHLEAKAWGCVVVHQTNLLICIIAFLNKQILRLWT